MSVRCINWAWQVQGLKPAHRVVLLCLADQAHDDGVCWPGKDYLAARCDVSKRTVDTAIETLSSKGLVRVRRRVRGPGLSDSNEYQLQIVQRDLFAPNPTEPTDDAPQKEPASVGGAEITPQGCKTENTGGAKTTPLGCKRGNSGASGGAIDDNSRGAIGGANIAPEPYITKKRATVERAGAHARARPDFSDWTPPATVIERCKLFIQGITDEFIEATLPEFLTFAEGHYRLDQLESKFFSNTRTQWVRAQNKRPGYPPKDLDGLMKWARENDAPFARKGEETGQYRDRICTWVDQGRPDWARKSNNPAQERASLAAGDDGLCDEMKAEMKRLHGATV